MENTPGALIAMSGGVDSSVAAYLMKQAGYRCMGATMRLYQNEDLGQCGFHTCCSAKDVEDAADVAFQLDIPFEVINYTDEFREKVIKKFIATYETGGTPNPCIDCNRYMKFDKMLAFAREHGLDYVVTGHYARIEQDPDTGRWLLKKALYGEKDQSYVLYVLTQDELAHTRFPLGGMDKPSIRALAEKVGFCNSASTSKASSCVSLLSSNSFDNSFSSNPVSRGSKSIPCKASISTRRSSSSQPASIAIRLSARMYAFFCASVR